jgi:hypothetical protein
MPADCDRVMNRLTSNQNYPVRHLACMEKAGALPDCVIQIHNVSI